MVGLVFVYFSADFINFRHACAARVTVVVLCVCVCYRSNLPPHTLESQTGFITIQEPFKILTILLNMLYSKVMV